MNRRKKGRNAMGKKALKGKKKAGNGQEPKYKTESGEEIKHYDESLYDHVINYFSRMDQFIDAIEMLDFKKIPIKTSEDCQVFLADMGRVLIKDFERKFNTIYDFLEKEIGDIRIEAAVGQPGTKEDTPLGAYIKTHVIPAKAAGV